MALFAFEELTFRYPEAPRDALRDVSVAIEPGQFVLVCGQSGCGKTTLTCGILYGLSSSGFGHKHF